MTTAFLFAPGAGASSQSAWMQGWAARLASLGAVVAFDYPYMKEGRKAPDRQPKLEAAHLEALNGVRARHSGPIVLVGKSMGSRIGCHVALSSSVDALVCFGYPLRGQNGALRDQVLYATKTPILFLQGTRDSLCPLDELEVVRRNMTAHNELHVVQEGDHSLVVTKRSGQSQSDVDTRIATVIADFLARNVAR